MKQRQLAKIRMVVFEWTRQSVAVGFCGSACWDAFWWASIFEGSGESSGRQKNSYCSKSVQQNSAHLRGPLNTAHQCLSKDKCLHSSSDVAALRKLMSVKAALGLRSTWGSWPRSSQLGRTSHYGGELSGSEEIFQESFLKDKKVFSILHIGITEMYSHTFWYKTRKLK